MPGHGYGRVCPLMMMSESSHPLAGPHDSSNLKVRTPGLGAIVSGGAPPRGGRAELCVGLAYGYGLRGGL